MPSPVGHSLAGLAFAAADVWPGRRWASVLLGVTIANLPDIDFLLGYVIGQPAALHWGFTHSFAFALFVGLMAGALAGREHNFLRVTAVAAGICASHFVLDMLIGRSPRPNFGLEILWPISSERFMLPWRVFQSYPTGLIHNDPLAALFSRAILPLVLREIGVLLPVAVAAWVLRLAMERRRFAS
jgi:membrane-bound metal-dependent hydrolase YbcI (DUF457 family)